MMINHRSLVFGKDKSFVVETADFVDEEKTFFCVSFFSTKADVPGFNFVMNADDKDRLIRFLMES